MHLEDKRDLERRLRALEQRTQHLPARWNSGGGGGGGTSPGDDPTGKGRSNCPTVESLPAVPTTSETFQHVFWTSEGDGTGDNGVWWTRTGLTRWYPMIYSTKDGAPGEEELA
jgi:hypothetical protein